MACTCWRPSLGVRGEAQNANRHVSRLPCASGLGKSLRVLDPVDSRPTGRRPQIGSAVSTLAGKILIMDSDAFPFVVRSALRREISMGLISSLIFTPFPSQTGYGKITDAHLGREMAFVHPPRTHPSGFCAIGYLASQPPASHPTLFSAVLNPRLVTWHFYTSAFSIIPP